MGLRVRVIMVLVIPALLVVAVHGFLRIRQGETQLLEQDQRNMALTARAIQIAVENALRDRKLSDVERLLSDMVEQQEAIDRIRLFDREIRPALVSNSLDIGETVPATSLRRVLATRVAEGFYEHRGDQRVLYYLVPLAPRAGRAELAMEIVHFASAIDRQIRAATEDVLVRLSILLLAMVVSTGLVLQRQVLRPLARLTEGIQRLGSGRAGPPLAVERRDELGRVAEAFNEMAERLEAAQDGLLAESERALELEQQLRRAETLAVAGKLASGLAHEVGTPLNIIAGRAEFLLKTLPLDGAARKDLETIVGQIDRISRIIGSLLDTVRFRPSAVRPTRIVDALDPLLPLLRHAARRRGVALTTAVPADLPPVLADASRLQQVVINLVLNAVEATPAGGRVTVQAGLAQDGDGPAVVLTVADTGAGIAADVVPRIFEPFFTTKPPGQGTGLGLAICRDIVRDLGGQIRVESEIGAGATFSVRVPIVEGARA
jgi:signal transduction histidine kinase